MAIVPTSTFTLYYNPTPNASHTCPKFHGWRWRLDTAKPKMTSPFIHTPISIKISKGRDITKYYPRPFTIRAIYTERTEWTTRRSNAKVKSEDPITCLNERVRNDNKGKSMPKGRVDPQEAQKYLNLIKEQKQKGLEMLKKDKLEGNDNRINYAIDPDTLVKGDYVVHKKVGVGQFVGVKKSEGKKYVYIQYADGMAKLPAKQAHRLLYRYHFHIIIASSIIDGCHHKLPAS